MTHEGPSLGFFDEKAVIITSDGKILRSGGNIADTLETVRENMAKKTIKEVSDSEEKTQPQMPDLS